MISEECSRIILNDSRKEYVARINIVQDYIEKHLDEELRVSELSSIALFSEFHFQRIYRMMTGESLYSYIKRIRLEKAVFLLRTNKNLPIQEIAFNTGFSSQSSLAKALKEAYGISGSRIRKLSEEMMIKILDNNSRNGKVYDYNREYNMPIGVDIKIIQPTPILYIRYIGAYKGNSDLFMKLFTKLYSYGNENTLISPKTDWFVLYHDFGELTEESKLRLSVAMSLEKEYKPKEEFGIMEISGGKYAVGKFILKEDEYQKAWNYMFYKWLPESGYIPDDKPCFERYPISENNKDGRMEVEICIPIILLC
jgi:AraC family transcriptional regulator